MLDQSLPVFELLIVDDCSTDGSYEWLSSLTDRRIQLFRNKTNKGLFYNLNFLVNKTTAPLVKLWAQDDIMYPNCLEGFERFHKAFPQIGFSYCERDHIDQDGVVKLSNHVDDTPAIISPALHARIAYYTGSIAGNIANVCINRSALDKVGLFDEGMKISADFDMWVRLAQFFETGFIKTKLIKLRDHSGQLSRNEKYYINHVREDLKVYRYLDTYVTAAQKQEGHKIMQTNKLSFYYTLMLKAYLAGKFKTGGKYFRLIAAYQPILPLTVSFLKAKLFNKKHQLSFNQ